MNVSACLVTRGDVDMQPILDSIHASGIEDIVIWDNSQREDLAVYGRYAAIAEAKNELILTQDDDVLLPKQSLYDLIDCATNDYVVCNMPQVFRHVFYMEHALVGFGAVFQRDLPERAFTRFMLSSHSSGIRSQSPWFDRTCDIVFTALTPRLMTDVPYENLPHAFSINRMWKQADHITERGEMLRTVLQVRDAA